MIISDRATSGNTAKVQAVKHTGLDLVAVNVFAPGDHHQAERIRVDGPASVIVQRTPDGTSVAVSDPTTERAAISVIVRGPATRAMAQDDGVQVSRVRGGTRIDVTTHHAYGHSFRALLR